MLRICLISPRQDFLSGSPMYPPLGLYYLSSMLKQDGHYVRLVDLALNEPIPTDCNIYGITGTSSQIHEIEDALSSLPTDSRIVTVAGGPFATTEPNLALKMGFDYVIKGEGEYALQLLVNAVEAGIHVNKVLTPSVIDKLDNLPLPDRSQASKYHYNLGGKAYTTAITSRGCPYHCAFCSRAVFSHKVRFHSAHRVVNECKYIADKGWEGVYFYDDTFNLDVQRLESMAPELNDLGLEYRCFARGHLMSERVASLMKSAGFVAVGIGVESGSDTILSNINKGETTAQILEGIQCTLDAGLEVKTYFVVGLPGENQRTISATWDICKALKAMGVLDFNFSLLQVMPGSDIYNHPEKYELQYIRGAYMTAAKDKYVPTVSTPSLSPIELLRYRDALEEEFKTWSI